MLSFFLFCDSSCGGCQLWFCLEFCDSSWGLKKRKRRRSLRTPPNWGQKQVRLNTTAPASGSDVSWRRLQPPGLSTRWPRKKKSGVHPSRRKRRPLNLSRKLLSRTDTESLLHRASPISDKQLFFLTAPPLVNGCDFLFRGDEQLLLLIDFHFIAAAVLFLPGDWFLFAH